MEKICRCLGGGSGGDDVDVREKGRGEWTNVGRVGG